MRITVEGNRAEITIGQECKPEQWSSKTGRLTGTKENIKWSNAYLDNLQTMVYRSHKDLAQAGSPITTESSETNFMAKTPQHIPF